MKPNTRVTSTASQTTDVFADLSRDLGSSRKQNVDPNNDYVIKHRDDDPYGFWWIGREKGQVPEHLTGAYTSYEYAKRALDTHLQSN